jgi:hypothetical protein
MHNAPPAFVEVRQRNPVVRPKPGTGRFIEQLRCAGRGRLRQLYLLLAPLLH